MVSVDNKLLKVKVFGNGKQYFADVEEKGVGKYTVTIVAQTAGFYAVTVIYDNFKPVKMKVIFFERMCYYLISVMSTLKLLL